MHTARHNRSRSISASICLLVVVLLYAPLAGAAWSSYRSACCTSGQCAIPAHHHQKTPAEHANHMDCGHDMTGMMACAMSCPQSMIRMFGGSFLVMVRGNRALTG